MSQGFPHPGQRVRCMSGKAVRQVPRSVRVGHTGHKDHRLRRSVKDHRPGPLSFPRVGLVQFVGLVPVLAEVRLQGHVRDGHLGSWFWLVDVTGRLLCPDAVDIQTRHSQTDQQIGVPVLFAETVRQVHSGQWHQEDETLRLAVRKEYSPPCQDANDPRLGWPGRCPVRTCYFVSLYLRTFHSGGP